MSQNQIKILIWDYKYFNMISLFQCYVKQFNSSFNATHFPHRLEWPTSGSHGRNLETLSGHSENYEH